MAWHLITRGDDQNSDWASFLIDNDEDIETPVAEIPYSYSLSSIAHTPGYARMWEANANKEWVEIGGEA